MFAKRIFRNFCTINKKLPKIGDVYSLKTRFTEKDVLLFSDICGDKNPLHIDQEAAKKSIFKQRVVHGILGASLFSNLLGNNLNGAIYLSQDLQFLAPIFFDEEIEAKVEIIQHIVEKNHYILNTTITKLTENKLATSGKAKILYKANK